MFSSVHIPLLAAGVWALVGCASAEDEGGEYEQAFEDALVTVPPERRSDDNVALGIPVDESPEDDALVDRAQYTLSYNRFLNLPNWVSWHVTGRDYGTASRRSSFYVDPKPLGLSYRVRSSDFVGSGYDQGHICPSEQRTSSVSANRATFFMANIVPQSPEANRGPWLDLERYADGLVRAEGKDLYIVAGPILPKGCMLHRPRTSKKSCPSIGAEGAAPGETIAVPEAMFKIIVPVARGASIASARAEDIVAVIVPNDTTFDAPWFGPMHKSGTPGPRSSDYVRTVQEIEALTGYALLEALPPAVKRMRFALR